MPADTPDSDALDIERNGANHLALSPLTFIERAAKVYPERTAIVHGALRQAPLDPGLVLDDDAAVRWLEEMVEGIPREEGS